MITSKKELLAALKLAASSKTQKWPAFARFKTSARGLARENPAPEGESDVEFARRQAREFKETQNYFGRLLMQTSCGLWESEFYFKDKWPYEEIVVGLDILTQAVKALGSGEIELIAENGFLHIWQGKECIKIEKLILSEEIKKEIPHTTLRELNRGIERWFNIYEFYGVIKILKRILTFAAKTDFGRAHDSVYFENRAWEGEEYEDLILAACDGQAVAAGKQIVERMGGFGIFLLPANAARKICAAAKLFAPEGMLMRLDNDIASFEIGRAIISAKLIEGDFINPEVARHTNVAAAFEINAAQITRLAKKAKIMGRVLAFRYKNGILAAAAGCADYEVGGVIPAGKVSRPLESEFNFNISADTFCEILKNITAETINLYYSNGKLLYVAAEGINYGIFLPAKQEDKNEKNKEND
ncbi:MAG: hypothetical protein LBG46_01070 [Elusimicrobiota bacterium]|jgi:hypothetical protein|nr:hypothetical protein [Elusimicrobiota bacterium]